MNEARGHPDSGPGPTDNTDAQPSGPDVASPLIPRPRRTPADPVAARVRRQRYAERQRRQASLAFDQWLKDRYGIGAYEPNSPIVEIDYASTGLCLGMHERRDLAGLAAVVAERIAAAELAMAELATARDIAAGRGTPWTA